MLTWLRNNGLSLALLSLFALSEAGHIWSGWLANNEDLRHDGAPGLALRAYLTSGAFTSSLFENWESEFLQMGTYVVLTAYLFQRGSPESKDPDDKNPQDRDPVLDSRSPGAPWPVRAGGLARALYAHSLGLALFALFLASFVLHWINSTRAATEAALRNGRPAESLLHHLFSAQLWYESFQNWQSEFLSTAVLILLGVVLRERGSPESKPVSTPNAQTGA